MFQKYLEYIKNTGGNPSIEWFDTDWEPIGPKVRKDMVKAGLIKEVNGKLEIIK
jgi:hypothetical protein